MRGLTAAGLAGLAALAATPLPSAVPIWHRHPGATRWRPPVPVLTPARYRIAMAPVETCADFFGRMPYLPDARPLLRTLFADGVPEKDGSETSDQFVARVVQRLFARLGDPSRLHVSLPVGPAAHYDADRGNLVIVLPRPLEAVLDSWTSAPAPAPAGAAPVRTANELRAGFEFPAGALPQPISVPMTADQAARFKAGGGRLHILALLEDYGTDTARAAPTPDRPVAVRTSYRLVRLTPKCAILGNAGGPIGGWDYDGWSDAAPAG